MYLVVEPPSDTNTLTVTVVVKMFASLKPTTASSLLDVYIVVDDYVICEPFDSKSCAMFSPIKRLPLLQPDLY